VPRPPKQATADDAFAAIVAQAKQAATEIGQFDSNLVFGPWREYATAVGQSGPMHINRATRAIRAIKGTGR
jgi:hypothetical protein